MDEPNYAAELKQAADVFNSNRITSSLMQALVKMFGVEKLSFGVLIKVSKNIRLFQLFEKIPGEKFIKLKKALDAAAADVSRGKILIYFTDLELYGLFEPMQYQSLVAQLYEGCKDDNNISFHPRQIILSELPQKPVFICLGDETIVEKIRRYVTKKYKCDIVVKKRHRTEITLQNITTDSYKKAQNYYYDLLESIAEYKIRLKLLPCPLEKCDNYLYTSIDTSFDYPQDIIPGGISFPIDTVNISSETNLSVGDATENWIRNNPPKGREKKTDYYAKYKTVVKNHVKENVFGRKMKELGYETIKTAETRYWIGKNTISNNILPHADKVNKTNGYSRVCIQWLDSISDKIQHAERGGEFRITGTNYRADGYDPTTNTIYEFHGSYWHGDPKVYNANDMNETLNCTFGELYQKTLKKEQTIRDLGYNLVVMWESEYNKL